LSRFLRLTMVIIMLVMVMVITGCGKKDKGNDVGTGSKEFMFEVTDADKNVIRHTIRTEEETVGAALLKEGLIEGEESSLGLMVTVVNGIKADYAKDKAYWAFYIDGEYAMTGADSTGIEKDKVYAFIYTQD